MVENTTLRSLIAEAAFKSGGGHIPSCYSCVDLINALFEKFDFVNSQKYKFVLSKGHAALALYTVLVQHGLLKKEDLFNLNKANSSLGGHPDASKIPTVLFNTGSLGHGLPCSIGYAIANKNKKNLFCLLGDGECNEGTTWEAAALANHLKIGNLTVIVDYNKSTNNVLPFHDLPKIWESFGWEVLVINGHNKEEITKSYDISIVNVDKPKVIIANTVKGYGIPFMENNGTWHYKCPSLKEMEEINKILGIS